MLEKFYLIVDSSQWLERLLPVGVKLVQLRIKDQPLAQVEAEIIRAKALCEKYNCTLVINDYWQQAIDLGCDWLHLGQEDLADADVNAIRNAGLKLGISTHSEAELDTALAVKPEYLALGPVYPTILKKMPWEPQGLERVSQWKQQLGDTPLVGIGGLSVERADGVWQAGADSLAVVTDVLLNADPEARTQQWLQWAASAKKSA